MAPPPPVTIAIFPANRVFIVFALPETRRSIWRPRIHLSADLNSPAPPSLVPRRFVQRDRVAAPRCMLSEIRGEPVCPASNRRRGRSPQGNDPCCQQRRRLRATTRPYPDAYTATRISIVRAASTVRA